MHIPKVIITLAIALFILVALTQNYKNRQISSPFAQEIITHPSSPSTSAKIELQPVIFNQEHQNRKLFGTFVKGRVIVKLASALQLQTDSENPLVPIDTLSDTTTQNSSFKSLLDSLQFQSITPLSHATKSNIQNVYILDGTQLDVMSAIQSLKQSPLVMIAQPDYYLYTDQSPINEPFLNDREPPAHERQLPEFQGSWNQDFDFQWNLKTIGINKDTDFTQQKEVVVAVLDSGVDYNHTELRDNMWINRSENPSNRRDDDGNGFVDDYRGWDALDFIARVEDRDFRIQPDNDPMDNATESYFQAANVRVGGGHGTAVAGIIGGRINNYGMIGINPHAKIMPLRVCDASGICPSSAIIQMLEYAIDKKVDVINMSFGRNEPDEITQNLVKEAYKKGIVLIAAAGNDGNSKANHYPADYNEVVSVSAIEPNDSISDYSHVSENVDISAPASFVVTPRGSQTDMACVFSSDCNFRKVDHSWVVIGQNLDFTVFSGTSSSSPHVAAAASLLKGKHPSLSNKEIIHILLNSADDLGAPGFDPQFGYGRLHLQKALSEMNTS
ncbi:S8 family serine peptidase, partial [Candidatus Woesebacteria bacterium]|nr:S8 family serine peptidase [Candidatus Woesebacteria bacterium]